MESPDFTPEWAKHAIWYQIFPERFCNGDPTNDPTLASLQGSYPHDLSEPWQVHPWTADIYQQQPYELVHHREIWHHLQRRRYGGDLQGIFDRLDYLQDLGITALYINPLFQAPSAHKYDGATYHHIDPHFGPDPQGDQRLIDGEIPADPATWVWTAADRMFLELVAEVHRRGMRIIIDGVFNHMGLNSWIFRDVVQKGRDSIFRDWFNVLDWQQPSRFAPFTYSGWYGVPELPELNQDVNGITAGPKSYIFEITRRWMDPDGDGDPGDGIDGWRLDVAFCIRHGFWKDWRRHVKAINPDAYLVAEIVMEDDNVPYLQGDEFDAEMNYRWTYLLAEFFAEERTKISVSEFDRLRRELRQSYPQCAAYVMHNLLSSHDTDRMASHIVNRDFLRYREWKECGELTRPHKNPAYDTRRPDAFERQLFMLMVLLQMTDIGAPIVYYGDEAGMWGANDPCCRKPMVWPELNYEVESVLSDGTPRPAASPVSFDHELFAWYKKLIAIRRSSLALRVGDLQPVIIDDEAGVYAFLRRYEDEQVLVVINNSAQPWQVQLPEGSQWQNLLEKEDVNPVMVLESWTGGIWSRWAGEE